MMSQGMMHGGVGLLAISALVLLVGALAKYLFFE
jgi:hypothetical protein